MEGDINKLTNLLEFLDCEGHVSLGPAGGVSCAAVASDEHNQLAAVARKPGESIFSLLARLDEAIDKAWNEESYVDEINDST